MNENEIEPVRRFAVKKDVDNHYVGMEVHSIGAYVLYGEHQSAIDRLTAERDAAVADAASLRERMLALEAQRDEFGDREWQAEKAKRKAEAERDASQELLAELRAERDAAAAAYTRLFVERQS